MDRRRFLVGLGAFAGAAVALPRARTIFDMGRDLPALAPAPPMTVEATTFTAGQTIYVAQWVDVTHLVRSVGIYPGSGWAPAEYRDGYLYIGGV